MIKYLLVLLMINYSASAQSLYEFSDSKTSHVSSFENSNGKKGAGGKTNNSAKGNAFEMLKPGESKTLLDFSGQGIIQRIWLTINQNPILLRSLRLEIFWDNMLKPAVDVPLGDFFGLNTGKPVAYQSALFATAEGRSFNCYVPMPFRKHAKIVLLNEGKTTAAKLFYDIDFVAEKSLPPSSLYFHASWTRQRAKELGESVNILPKIIGKGRYLGMSAALLTDSSYGNTWWGEGEVKMFVDGDSAYPSINGTGAEDYIGSAWGLGRFTNLYDGCLEADTIKGRYSFYRFHIPDEIFFNKNIQVTWQQIGGGNADYVKELIKKGVALKPVSVDDNEGFHRLLDHENSSIEKYKTGWIDFYRNDDYAITAYYYLDNPGSDLPPLADVSQRIKNVQ
jgi:hypothetical protein